MNDRFKFRVKFETDEKIEIFDVTNINFEHGQIHFIREDSNLYNIGIGVDSVELLQCTGLKDKKGKLIYEGDIVKHKYEKIPSYVKYNKKEGAFNIYNKDDYGYLLNAWGDLKIIGNIYENPELLESKE